MRSKESRLNFGKTVVGAVQRSGFGVRVVAEMDSGREKKKQANHHSSILDG
jgi:hypothetical protein